MITAGKNRCNDGPYDEDNDAMSFFERNRRDLAKRGIDPGRLPSGQYNTDRFPVLHVGDVPTYDMRTWTLQIFGNVERPITLSWEELLELPSPTRNFIAFVAMVPGVQLNPSAEGSDSISVNGQSNNQVTFVLDGGNNTDDNSASASGAQARTPLETVEEGDERFSGNVRRGYLRARFFCSKIKRQAT